MAQEPHVGQRLLMIKAPRSHWHTPHSVGLPWTCDQSDPETSTWQHTTLTRHKHPCPDGIRTHNASKRAATSIGWQLILLFGVSAPSWQGSPHSRGFQITLKDSSGRVISSSQRPLPVATQCSQQSDIHAPGGIRTHNLSRREAADSRLRPRGRLD
jgi:hypothetical protein